ncbi:MAG: response regulator [Dehalococcoidales bacterium]|nr:response regulator [Dehalococcoidales bacterium]
MDRKTILIVDDEKSIRVLVNRFLSRYYTVLEAENGAVAIDVVRREKPDLVLMDIMMPKLDGYTACAEIKDDELTRGTKVIMLTSIAYQLNKSLAEKIGADGYITKPLDLKELHAAIEQFLVTP